MRNFTQLILLLISTIVFPQEQRRYFDDALSSRITGFNKKLEQASRNDTNERSTFLFDSLVSNHLKNTYLRPLVLDKTNGGTFDSDNLNLPFIIVTKSAGFIQEDDEVNLINDFALRFKEQVRILLIYWGDEKKVKKLTRGFNKYVITTYINEVENRHSHFTAIFKHAFGTPSCFYISKTKQLNFIDRSFNLTSNNERLNSLNDTTKQLSLLIFKDENTDQGVFTTVEEPKDKP